MDYLETAFKWSLIACISIFVIATNASGDRASTADTVKSQPLWELGAMAAAAQLPHYIGSDEYQTYIYPLPYFTYRGKILRADREGIRGIFYKGEKIESSLSFWGNPPVSEENEAREGMPELDAVGEVGPAIRYYFYRHGWQDHLYLQVAWRAAFSFGFNGGLDIDMNDQGWHSNIDLDYQNKSLFEDQRLTVYLKSRLHFADSTFNNYFYGVPSRYETSRRNQYKAEGGYAGFSLSGSIYKAFSSRLSIGFYARWDNLNGAVFEDSPLVRDKNNYAVGSLLIWKLAKSSRAAK